MEIYGMAGEPLGQIGQAQRPPRAEPEWKKALTSKPSISIRKGIAVGFETPYENTSTLVLTAPSGTFVDIRFALGEDPMSDKDGFWAFAGTAFMTFPTTDGGVEIPYMCHGEWKRDVDSRGDDVKDEGDMFLLPDGSCVEVGCMVDPRDREGRVKIYKEHWVGGEGEANPCVVARREDSKGVVVRVGDWCQGVVQKEREEGLWVERWARVRDEKGRGDVADWIKDFRGNTELGEQVDLLLPSMWVCGEGRRVGDETVLIGKRWRIEEVE